jgi:hypothetical protein
MRTLSPATGTPATGGSSLGNALGPVAVRTAAVVIVVVGLITGSLGCAGRANAADSAEKERGIEIAAAKEEKETKKGKKPAKKAKKSSKKKKAEDEPPRRKGIDVSETWRGENQVFTPEQLEKLEAILSSSTCRDEKAGCTYHDNGKAGSEASFDFRLIPWKVSGHRGYLVRNDRCGAGGCDEGLFVLIDGQWRLLIETFGILERARTSTHGFSDLTFRPRGLPPVRLVWDGRAYREEN